MNAQEARQRADNSQINEDSTAGILMAIKNESSKGKYEIWWYHPINDVTRRRLKELGYKVGKEQFDRNEISTQISW